MDSVEGAGVCGCRRAGVVEAVQHGGARGEGGGGVAPVVVPGVVCGEAEGEGVGFGETGGGEGRGGEGEHFGLWVCEGGVMGE